MIFFVVAAIGTLVVTKLALKIYFLIKQAKEALGGMMRAQQ